MKSRLMRSFENSQEPFLRNLLIEFFLIAPIIPIIYYEDAKYFGFIVPLLYILYIFLITEAYSTDNIFASFCQNLFSITLKNIMILLLSLTVLGFIYGRFYLLEQYMNSNDTLIHHALLVLMGSVPFVAVVVNIILSMADIYLVEGYPFFESINKAYITYTRTINFFEIIKSWFTFFFIFVISMRPVKIIFFLIGMVLATVSVTNNYYLNPTDWEIIAVIINVLLSLLLMMRMFAWYVYYLIETHEDNEIEY